MRRTKRILSILLVLMLAVALAVPALAETSETGTITIDKAVKGETYSIYQLMTVEYKDNMAFVYQATEAWEEWLREQEEYVVFDTLGNVTWNTGADAAAFAKNALLYAQTNKIEATESKKATAETVEFTDLGLGYYLVDSSLGALCSLDTTTPEADIVEKNAVPTIDKEVQEDSDGSWGTSNSAQIGDTVNFKITVTARAGTVNYVVHDVMEEALTFDEKSVRVTVYEVEGVNPTTGDYTYKTTGKTLTKDTDYTLTTTTDLTDDCTFEITYTNSFFVHSGDRLQN